MDKREFMHNWLEQNQGEPVPPDNEIWYWAPEKVTTNTAAGISSHVFENGKGIITVLQNENKVRNWFGGNSSVTEIKFGSQLTIMEGTGVFQRMLSLEKVSLPSGLTQIADYAFRYSSLRDVLIPETVEYIGINAFFECSNLVLTSLPSRITSIANRCFSYCSNLALTSLPTGLVSIGEYSFCNCTSLALTELPVGVTSIGDSAFYKCWYTTPHAITFLGTPTSIASNAFMSNTVLTNIYVPWAEGEVANAPWGATNATIWYNHTP